MNIDHLAIESFQFDARGRFTNALLGLSIARIHFLITFLVYRVPGRLIRVVERVNAQVYAQDYRVDYAY